MQENGKGKTEDECEAADPASETHKEKGSYYYDDAHGYEKYDPDTDEEDLED